MPTESIRYVLEVITGERPFEWLEMMKHVLAIIQWLLQQFEDGEPLIGGEPMESTTLETKLRTLLSAKDTVGSELQMPIGFWREFMSQLLIETGVMTDQ